MSVLKKPKRNIRRRDLDNEENEVEDSMEINCVPNKKTTTNKLNESKVKKEKKKPSVLSFEEEWNDADDGEVFQVKKSSHSKKIRKMLEKEKDKKKKDDKVESDGVEITGKTKEITFNNELTIKIRNNLPLNPILNGREAEMADKDGTSSDDERGQSHKFSHPDHVKQLLKSGRIPDAAMIHAARKRRQQAREMGDFIPVEEKVSKYDAKQSRLVREDDNDLCDDDIRINMQVNTVAADLERRREAFNAALDHQGSEESDKCEEEEWEKQQIRKGVTGAQLAAAQQENIYYSYTMPQVPADMNMAMPVVVPPTPVCMAAVPDMLANSKLDPQSVAKRLKERLDELKEIHSKHTLEKEGKAKEIEDLRAECEKIKAEAPTLADRFRFYQDLRGYVTDLVECLDEKVVIINALEQRLLSLYRKRAMELMNRRRQDMRDQAEELAPSAKSSTTKRDEMQVRRAAEREGRRIRRMKVREIRCIQKHVEGMSSDDEVTEMESAMFRSQKEQIEKDTRHVFEDALDEFSTIHGVLQRFDMWKRMDRDAYIEAYVHLCLAKALGPLVRLQILFWSPFNQGDSDLDRTGWSHRLLMYSIRDNETEELLKADPDVELAPKCIEKIIIPKLDQLVSAQWDPMSRSQSLALVNIVTKLLQDYPTLGPNSKVFTLLINNIVEKMKDAVDNDVFIPIYPRTTLDGRMTAFFQRQFASAVKLLSNIVRWQGLLSDEVICEVALDSLLNRYLLMAIRICDATEAALKCNMVGSVLPRVWLHFGNIPSQLMPLLNQVKSISLQLDPNKPLNRDALEKISGLLKAAP